MSYAQFQAYLDSKGQDLRVKEDLVERMKQLIVRSIFATKKTLDPHKRKSCFELFGYDFIIDEDFNLWLIEINTNPCIEESSSILKVFLPRMIDDMLKLSVDTFYSDFQSKSHEAKEEHRFPVEGYSDEENMWELLVNVRDKKSRKEAKAQYF